MGLENSTLKFQIAGGDIDNDGLVYSVISALPAGAKFDPKTREFSWKPNYEQAGEYKVKFAVLDSAGEKDVREVTIAIAPVNRKPTLTVAPQIVALGEKLKFKLSATDADANTTLTYGAINLPNGAVLNSETGEVEWTPSPGQVGDYIVSYAVSDGEDTIEKNALIRVETTPSLPVVNIDLTPSFPVVKGQKVTIQMAADSFTSIAGQEIKVNGKSLTLDKFNRAVFTPDTTGRFEVVATATDAAGRVGTNSTILKVRDINDVNAPIVAFAPGINGKLLRSLIV